MLSRTVGEESAKESTKGTLNLNKQKDPFSLFYVGRCEFHPCRFAHAFMVCLGLHPLTEHAYAYQWQGQGQGERFPPCTVALPQLWPNAKTEHSGSALLKPSISLNIDAWTELLLPTDQYFVDAQVGILRSFRMISRSAHNSPSVDQYNYNSAISPDVRDTVEAQIMEEVKKGCYGRVNLLTGIMMLIAS